MVYPNFENKHLEKPIINAKDFVDWTHVKKKFDKNAPNKYIIIYYTRILNYFKKKYKPKKIKYNRLITIYKYKNIGVVKLDGIGAPNAATCLEELIALGGKEFLNIGSAGGLDEFGIFLCTGALRDEGTSYHYVSHGKYSYPDKDLTNRLMKRLKEKKIDFQKSITWTIDAPYKETVAEFRHYKKEGIKIVEMEASALFAVAKLRKVKIASAFVVSDILTEEKWNPQFHARHVTENLNKLFDIALDTLSK